MVTIMFSIFKKNNIQNKNSKEINKLDKNGELPFGWIYENREFIKEIESKQSYFLHAWIESRDQSPKEEYASLKSYLIFLHEAQTLCMSKGECFEKWFNDIIADADYLKKWNKRLSYLYDNINTLTKHYDNELSFLNGLEDKILSELQQHNGILQTDFYKLFDEKYKNVVSEKLYFMTKENIIIRTKIGRTYKLELSEVRNDGNN